uniref:Secreted protein n=1 Tax=Panagrolaimus sp. JU765 TaxID=591449 RepID=A0AC34QPN4_9BILA
MQPSTMAFLFLFFVSIKSTVSRPLSERTEITVRSEEKTVNSMMDLCYKKFRPRHRIRRSMRSLIANLCASLEFSRR